MKDTFTFNHHGIGIKVFGGVPHFCAADIGKVCGYKSGMSTRKEDKTIRSGAYNYISLHLIGQVLGRPTGVRRVRAQELLAAIEKEFALALPVSPPALHAAPFESSFDVRIKRNQLEMEIDELMAEEAEKQSAIYKMQRSVRETRARLYERERELSAINSSSVSLMRLPERVVSNG